jgi:hypothetical protein
MQRKLWVTLLTVLLILAAATVYEMLVALKVIELGSLPGEGPPGAELMGFVAAIGLLAAAVLSGLFATIHASAPTLSALLAPAAGGFLLAHFYTFDSYYLPTLVRYAERNFIPPAVVFVLVGLSLAAGLATLHRRRAGLALSVPLILACALTAFFTGVGH